MSIALKLETLSYAHCIRHACFLHLNANGIPKDPRKGIKMINLKIEDYCQECPDFEAEVEKITFSDLPVKNDTLIRCKNHVRFYTSI